MHILCIEYGPAVIDHVLLTVGLKPGMKWGKDFDLNHLQKLSEALQEAEKLLDNALQSPAKVSLIESINCLNFLLL